jgi:WD40 repeat protein
LEHGAFETWLENSNYKPCLLWIYGNAASGKSVLSSFIIDHLNRHGKICQYFFVRFGDQRKRSVQAVLRSLSAQIARAVPEYGKKLMKLASDAIDLKTADVRSLWKWLFSNGVCAMELQKPLYWVLDGVDELDDPETMIKLLSDLSSYKVPIRLLLVSRKTQELSSAIQKLGKGLDMISIRREGSLDDFKRFIDEEMDDVAGNESHKSRVTSLILERASGNFLWVHFAVQRINKCISQKDVEEALEQLPTGMGALYDRMASTIADNPNDTARHLAKDILAWTTCARRLMTIAELSGALGEDAPLDMQRSIGNLCGGFVVVDIDGKVALIHQTARQYLFSQSNQFFAIRKQSAHALLFNRCMSCLMEPNLRAKINRNQEPDFLDYAISSWFVHFCLADETSSSILPTVTAFLKGPYVLTWIHSVAKSGNMQPLVLASQYLTTFLTKRRGWHHHLTSHDHFTAAQETIERWAIDILKLVGKFGRSIVSHPQAIYRLIAPFCPHESIMYQQFGRKESSILSVTGFSNKTWDDCLGRISLEQGTFTSSVLAAGSRIGILSLAGRSSTISIYHASTFEDLCQITHAERVLKMHLNNSGDILVTYGYSTTKAWDLITGRCIKSVTNPENRPWPHTILFTDRDNTLLAGCDDRRLRSLTLGVASSQWEVVADFDEKQHEGTIVNSPTCMALSPEGDLMALGYRGHPLTLWEVCEPKLTAQCTRTLGGAFETTASEAWGEVIQLAWHPFSGQVLGLYLEGTLFKWQPFENEVQEIMAGANKLAVNRDGALCATGDANGTIKVFHTANFSLCYRLCSEDPVLDLSFSFDSRRVYDVRGTYANMWEPNILVRIVGNPDLLERSSDDASSSESLIKPYTSSECWFGKIDTVSAICAQKAGPLYCYGTEEGVVNLCERGRGKVGELQRSKSFMSIEHITWSDDGKFVAFGDTSGKLVVKSIDVNSDGIDPWSISTVMDTFVSVPGGEIVQLLFHPRGDKFLVCTATGLRTIGIGGTVISEISGAGMSPVLKWMCHPSSTEHLIGFGKESLHIYNWNTLGETNCITYQVSESDATTSAAYRADRWGSRKATVRVTLTTDSTRFLVQIFSPLPDSRKEVHYFFISVEALNTQAGMLSVKNNISENDLSMVIPLECESELRMPLCFLPRGRLVFLDINYAFCTGRLPMDANVGRRRSSTKTTTITTKLEDVKRHFVLPADWISSESAALCCTFTDGTLLYPKNGEVAVIQFDSLRQGSI